MTYRWAPSATSIAASDRDSLLAPIKEFCEGVGPQSTHWLETNPTRVPADWGIEFLARCIRTSAESISAMGVLLQTGEHLRAPLILARSCIEATATACHLVDPSVNQRERTRRILNLHMAQVKESLLETARSHVATEEEVELDELMAFATHLGYDLARYRPDKWQPPVITSKGATRDPATAIIDHVLPDVGRSIWRSLSAVAHARSAQTLMPDEYTLPQNLEQWQRTEVVARNALPAVLVLRELCARLTNYLGWPYDELDELIDVVSRQLAVAGGMADAQIRLALDLPPP